MKRIIILLLSCILLLTGCSAVSADIATIEEAAVVETASVIPVETFGTEKDGYCLTYPASFDLTDSGDDYYKFTDSEQDLSISLSIEENTYSDLSVEEYPEAMGLEMYSKPLTENSFDRDIYVQNDQSCYSIYTLTDEFIYCVEYTYQGEPGQDSLIDQLSFEAYGEFSGSDNTDTLMSYAEAHLDDLMGNDNSCTLTYDGIRTINSLSMTVFQVYDNDQLISLIAVNTEGTCFVDNSATGNDFINIELLLYDTTENTNDRLMYYAMYYYEELFGSAPSADSIVLYNADYYFNNQHLTVYSVSTDPASSCLIGIADNGVGYVDRSGSSNEFEKIENLQ